MPLIDNFIPGGGVEYAGGIVDDLRGFDPLLRRPFIDGHGKACVIANTGQWTVEKGVRVPIRRKARVHDLLNAGYQLPAVVNATSLRKEQWIEVDRVALLSARQRMRAWLDLAAANSYGGFNAMARTTLEYEAMSDPGEALVDMDALSEGRTDSPLFKLRSIPLPITHSDFWFSKRRLDISRNGDLPLDTTMIEASGRRVGEAIEKTTIGVQTGITYGTQSTGVTAHDGTSVVQGYTNFTNRNTKTDFTAPTAGGWTPETTYNEILTALNTLYDDKFYGPFLMYHSTDWSQYVNRQFSVAGGNAQGETLLTMLKKIDGIQDVRRLDFLTSTFTFILVQMTPDVARAINGMDVTVIQWETVGGFKQNFKTMAIQVPQLRSDYSGNAGILHGTT